MADVIMKQQVTALIGRCYTGLDVADLRDEVLRRLRRDPADRPARGRGPAASRHPRPVPPVRRHYWPAGAPGIILLDQDLALMTMSPEAAQWLAEIDEADWPGSSELPMAVYAAAARLAGWNRARLRHS